MFWNTVPLGIRSDLEDILSNENQNVFDVCSLREYLDNDYMQITQHKMPRISLIPDISNQ